MKPGREIARFEQRVAAHSTTLCRAYQALLRECGSTLYRWYSPTSKVTNAWRRVRGWALKFPNLEAARADYLKHGYVELPVTGRAQPSRRKLEAAIKRLQASGQDRVLAVSAGGGYLLAVADGAGGTGDGAAAAERLITGLAKLAGAAASTDWFEALLELDDELLARRSGSQTTGVVAYVSAGRVVGASVGDSSAWLISPAGETTDLTAHQRRRPPLGSGEALPVIFEARLRGCRLVLGSDGLFKYATTERICALAMQGSSPRPLILWRTVYVCSPAGSRTTQRSWSSHNGPGAAVRPARQIYPEADVEETQLSQILEGEERAAAIRTRVRIGRQVEASVLEELTRLLRLATQLSKDALAARGQYLLELVKLSGRTLDRGADRHDVREQGCRFGR